MSVEVIETVEKQGLTTREAMAYVGGKPVWDALLAKYPTRLVPFYRTAVRGNARYRRETIDHVMQVAEAEGSLVAPEIKGPPAG